MANAPSEPEHGAFHLRYELLPHGRIRVRYRFDDHPEVGPVEVEEVDAKELGALIERIAMLVNRVHLERQGQSLPPDHDEEPSRTHTDPSALRRRR
ncbi:MAG: hypothetical protein JWN48_6046 [Myxococcaceae bacterium]|nr:hypothetical protein [Myxococcaceae bacterium]